jgi:activator of HSP90 ATPase
MKAGTIRQKVTIHAGPLEVYQALMTSRGHAAFTGAPAKISPRVGGAFTAWGGYIHGRNVRLTPGKKIVQEWRPSEASWPVDHFSMVTFSLEGIRGGTRISFTQTKVPEEHVGHLSTGWKESYWEPLEKYFTSRPR